MYSFIKEIDNYSVSRDYEIFQFKKKLYESKLGYLKFANYPAIDSIINPTAFRGLVFDEEQLEKAVDVSDNYPVSLEEEKELITKRAANLAFIRDVNDTFTYCRNTCKVPEPQLRNIHFLENERQACVTDCLNVRIETSGLKKPHNSEKTFVWLA